MDSDKMATATPTIHSGKDKNPVMNKGITGKSKNTDNAWLTAPSKSNTKSRFHKRVGQEEGSLC